MKPKVIPAKVGTQPWLIILFPRTKLEFGKRVKFRDKMHGSQWIEGIVDNLEPLRISLI